MTKTARLIRFRPARGEDHEDPSGPPLLVPPNALALFETQIWSQLHNLIYTSLGAHRRTLYLSNLMLLPGRPLHKGLQDPHVVEAYGFLTLVSLAVRAVVVVPWSRSFKSRS